MTGVQMRDRPTVQPYIQLPVDPRIEARWVSVRRDQRRRRRKAALGALAAVTVLAGAWILARSPVLSVQQVVVRGIAHTSRGTVVAAARLDRPRPMLDIDPARIRRQVGALPWVAQVRVRRRWPTTVTIDITERSPLAQVAGSAGQPAVVDASGRVLAIGGDAWQVLGTARPALPMVLGVPVAGAPGTTVARAADAALKVVQALSVRPPEQRPSAVAFMVTGVTRAVDGTVSASLAPGPVGAVFGSTDDLDAKLIALRSVLAQLAPNTQATIDVRVADAPVLTAEKKSTIVSTTQRG